MRASQLAYPSLALYNAIFGCKGYVELLELARLARAAGGGGTEGEGGGDDQWRGCGFVLCTASVDEADGVPRPRLGNTCGACRMVKYCSNSHCKAQASEFHQIWCPVLQAARGRGG